MSFRLPRVNSLIKNELSRIILKELDLSRDILVTLTRVETAPNLSDARIYISVLPDEKSDKIFRLLNKMVYFLQKKLDKRLRMRPIPKIIFFKEEKTEEADKIEEILEEIKEK